MKTTEPIRDKRKIRQLAEYYRKRGQIRNYVLIVMGLHTALRISDLLRLRWEDVFDFVNGRVRQNITITEKKTGKTKTIALHANIITALQLYADSAKSEAFLFENPRTKKAISRIQAYRIIRASAEAVGIPTPVSCHSLRKTFGYHAWKDCKGKDKELIIMKIYNHSSFAITSRYLGITQDDINAVYLEARLFEQ
jgi:integrase